MNRSLGACAAALLGLWAMPASAQPIWACEVLHSYDLGAGGTFDRNTNYVGDRFTANDATGEVMSGKMLGQPKDWKAVLRRFGPNQDGFQSIRLSDGRQLAHLYIETFATGPAKPFLLVELEIGATRIGTCRARP